jgi:hypothetical protein
MSKARLVITAVNVEKRPVREVARTYGVARSWGTLRLASTSPPSSTTATWERLRWTSIPT